MWPSKNKGEDARLYYAVEAISNFAIELGINIPTGKDSLSMTQKYPMVKLYSLLVLLSLLLQPKSLT